MKPNSFVCIGIQQSKREKLSALMDQLQKISQLASIIFRNRVNVIHLLTAIYFFVIQAETVVVDVAVFSFCDKSFSLCSSEEIHQRHLSCSRSSFWHLLRRSIFAFNTLWLEKK